MSIKHIFFDIDGTLSNRNITDNAGLSDKTLMTLKKLQTNGHKIYIATGRSHHKLGETFENIGFDGYIYCDGTHVKINGKTVYKKYIPEEKIKTIIEESRKRGISVLLTKDDKEYLDNNNKEAEAMFVGSKYDVYAPGILEVCELNDYTGVYKFNLIGTRKYTLDELDYLTGYKVTFMPPGLHGMHNPDETKADGLQVVIDKLNLNITDTIAIGDADNDLEIFEASGLSICMGNGTDIAKQTADIVTDHIDDEGLSKAFEDLKLA